MGFFLEIKHGLVYTKNYIKLSINYEIHHFQNERSILQRVNTVLSRRPQGYVCALFNLA